MRQEQSEILNFMLPIERKESLPSLLTLLKKIYDRTHSDISEEKREDLKLLKEIYDKGQKPWMSEIGHFIRREKLNDLKSSAFFKALNEDEISECQSLGYTAIGLMYRARGLEHLERVSRPGERNPSTLKTKARMQLSMASLHRKVRRNQYCIDRILLKFFKVG